MRIEHVAIWTRRLEQLRAFYETFFGAEASAKYVNQETQFESYFLTLSSGARLELMRSPAVSNPSASMGVQPAGYAHVAFSVGSREQVETLTAHLRAAGYEVARAPRFAGDGYYESVVLDPDGNQIEITI
jgi:lactoylglutathione lyase